MSDMEEINPASPAMVDETERLSPPPAPDAIAEGNGRAMRASSKRRAGANANTIEEASQFSVPKRRTRHAGGSITIEEEIGFDAALEKALADSLQDTGTPKPNELAAGAAKTMKGESDLAGLQMKSEDMAKAVLEREYVALNPAAAFTIPTTPTEKLNVKVHKHSIESGFSSSPTMTQSAKQTETDFTKAFKIKEARYAKKAAKSDHLLRLPPTAKYVYVNKIQQTLVGLHCPPYHPYTEDRKPRRLHPILKEAEKNGTATTAMRDWFSDMPHHVNSPIAGKSSDEPHRPKYSQSDPAKPNSA